MSASLNIPYSAQYLTTTREGHEHPPQAFGAPTLIWHLGISPHWPDEHPEFDGSIEELHARLAIEYEETRAAFFGGVNRLLLLLQVQAGVPREKCKTFNARTVPAPWSSKRKQIGEPFLMTEPGNIRFTLWWADNKADQSAEPNPHALRVKVNAAAHRDFVVLTLFIDAGKPWDLAPFVRGQEVVGGRRQRIFAEVGNVQRTCEGRLKAEPGSDRLVDCEVLPEVGIASTQARALMGASRYLYSEIWDEFCSAFAIMDLDAVLGRSADGKEKVLGAGRVFANFRGLVVSTFGVDGSVEEFPGSSGLQPFARFAGNGGLGASGRESSAQVNEANAVIKAFWPFIRRITPFADQREFIVSGIMGWRALYITALGSPRAFDWREECGGPESEIPAGNLPEELIDSAGRYDSLQGARGEGPLRYLILTKGEPHRKQIGRIVDRINTIGTLRLVALRDWTIIRDASTQLQLRGLQLDTIMRTWSDQSRKIRERYERIRWWPFGRRRGGGSRQGKERRRWFPLRSDRRRDRQDEELQKLATKIEEDLIYLSAALDAIGLVARHGLHFRINRSRYYVEEFESLLKSLRIGNIDTWLAYDQFVTRGLKPAFDFIDGVGKRLVGLRTRLESVLEGIETSALVIQTSATRFNTAQLKRIARRFRTNNALVALIGAGLTYFASGGTWADALARLEAVISRLMEYIRPFLSGLGL